MKLIKPFKILFQPCIFRSLVGNGIVRNPNPLRHEFSGWLLSRTIYHPFSIKHPILQFSLVIINSHGHRLTQVGTSRQDVNHLNPEQLNAIHNAPYHVYAIRIKNMSRDDTRCLLVLPQDKHKINPLVHNIVIHPYSFG